MGLKWLIFLIGTPRFDWLVCSSARIKEQTSRRSMYTCLEEIGLRLSVLVIILHSIMNIIGRTYVSRKGITRHALVITITVAGDVRFSTWFS
jgi:hypothetical protein